MTSTFDPSDHPHRRYNPLTGEWILVSPHRAKRPWQGQSEEPELNQKPSYDDGCYLCPTNERMGGNHNPDYKDTHVFTNDFAAVMPNSPEASSDDPLFKMESEQGTARVICYSPDHSKTLAELDTKDILAVVNCWAEQALELGQRYSSVQIFENKGSVMGCSMPHPHGQIWAQKHLPTLVEKEHLHQLDYAKTHNGNLLLDYVQRELDLKERLVVLNNDWVVLVPYWATWPFETIVLPRFKVAKICDLNRPQKENLADILSQICIRYDNLFSCSFPYSMGWHGAPFDGEEHPEWQLHAHFFPPLLRSSSVRKFMVGYEMMAESQRDITPEKAAERLRNLPANHYKNGNS